MAKNSLSTVFLVTRKILWHVHLIGIAITAIEVVLESERHDKMLETMDAKVNGAKKELTQQIFDLKLTDLKSKFLAIKSTFELVLYGTDDVELRKSRLDSVFVICEEIYLTISESHSDLYKSAHCWIDLVSWFVVMHLGMLNLAVESFELIDYKDRLDYCLEFYPLLIKSYIEQAISNYVKPIIVNYHNHYSSVNEVEEIYYELTDSVIYKITKNKEHLCWRSDKESLEKDHMYYGFKEDKFKIVEPAFFIGPETPLLWRALRYGVILKLEDLFTPYESSIDIIVHKMKNQIDKNKVENEHFNDNKENMPIEEVKHIPDEYFDDDIDQSSPIKFGSPEKHMSFTIQPVTHLDDISPIKSESVKSASPVKPYNALEKSEVQLVSHTNYHYKRAKKTEEYRNKVFEIKKQAKKDQIMLTELYNLKLSEQKYDDLDHVSNFEKLIFIKEFESFLSDHAEVYDNLSRYVIFSEENKRCFNIDY